MKIKPYKIKKREHSYVPFIIVQPYLEKPKIPLILIAKAHKPTLYQPPIIQIVYE